MIFIFILLLFFPVSCVRTSGATDRLARVLGYFSLGNGAYFDHPLLHARLSVEPRFEQAVDGLVPTWLRSNCSSGATYVQCADYGYMLLDGLDAQWFFKLADVAMRDAACEQHRERRVVLVTTADGRNPGLIGHFLTYYKHLGVDPSDMLVLLNARNANAVDQLLAAKRVLALHGAQYAVWVAEFSTANVFHLLHFLRRTRRCDWIVWTDIDEFHELRGKSVHETIDKLEEDNYNALTGRMIDRVARDGAFHRVLDQPSLFDQFPYECNVTEQILGGNYHKVLLASASLIPADGHHYIYNQSAVFANLPNYRFLARDMIPQSNSSVRARAGGTVWHFKWIAGVESYLADRVVSFKDHRLPWWTESQSFLDYVQENKAIDVSKHCRN